MSLISPKELQIFVYFKPTVSMLYSLCLELLKHESPMAILVPDETYN